MIRWVRPVAALASLFGMVPLLVLVYVALASSRSSRLMWLLAAVAALVFSLGYLWLAIAPRRVAGATLGVRVLVGVLLILPSMLIGLLLPVLNSAVLVGVGVFLLVAAAFLGYACLGPDRYRGPDPGRIPAADASSRQDGPEHGA